MKLIRSIVLSATLAIATSVNAPQSQAQEVHPSQTSTAQQKLQNATQAQGQWGYFCPSWAWWC